MRISERGQITIPKYLRDRFGMNRDVEVEITPTDGGLLIRKRAGRASSRGQGRRHPGQRGLRHRRVLGGSAGKVVTAVDTSVLLHLFRTNSPFHSRSREWLRRAYNRGAVIVCDLVYAELVPAFPIRASLDAALSEMGVALSPIDSSIAYEAGLRWKQYRLAGGPRERIMTDFLIGAHAVATSDSFLTRDRGVYSTYFPELRRLESP